MTARPSCFVGLLVLILVISPAIFIDLDRPGPKQWMEGVTLASSRETLARQQAGVPDAWLVPWVNDQPRARKPPLVVWINMLAWTGLDANGEPPSTMILRARLVSALLALVMVASTFWIGSVLRDRQLGLIAAAVLGTMVLFQVQGRMASYDIHLCAWSTLAVAAALWAMRPFTSGKAPWPRFAFGWLLASLALSAAVLSKGPLAYLIVLIPIGIVLALDRRTWASRLFGLCILIMTSGGIAGSWYLLFQHRYPDVDQKLSQEFQLVGQQPESFDFYARHLMWLAAPWTLWAIAGLFHPFMRLRGERRLRCFITWTWFILLMAAFSIPSTKSVRYLLALMPALALVAAQVWRDHLETAEQGSEFPKARTVSEPHWWCLFLAALLFGPFLAGQEIWVRQGWLKSAVVDPISWPLGILTSLGLTAIAWYGWRQQRALRIMPAMWACVIFAVLGYCVSWRAQARSTNAMQDVERAARDVRGLTGNSPMCYLGSRTATHPSYEFLFYVQRNIPKLRARNIESWAHDQVQDAFVFASESDSDTMIAADWKCVLQFSDGPKQRRCLWQLRGAAHPEKFTLESSQPVRGD